MPESLRPPTLTLTLTPSFHPRGLETCKGLDMHSVLLSTRFRRHSTGAKMEQRNHCLFKGATFGVIVVFTLEQTNTYMYSNIEGRAFSLRYSQSQQGEWDSRPSSHSLRSALQHVFLDSTPRVHKAFTNLDSL